MATFMPKPLSGVQGSGMHTHLSLFDGDTNAFHDEADAYHLSKVGPRFIAGLLVHAREITAVTNQWVNSYKRLIVGYEAPVYVSWARNNRSALVRVPPTKRGKKDSTRIEYRAPDSAANPYLAFAVMLAAGLAGIEQGYELPPEAAANLYELTPEQRLAEGIDSLPGSLAEAIDVMERSELVAETLGEHVFEWFVRNKRAEWADYKAQVTAVRAAPLPHFAVDGRGRPMEPLLLFPDPAPPALAQALDLAGYPWKAAGSPRRPSGRARRRLGRRHRLRRRRPRGGVRPVPGAAQARPAPRAPPAARGGHPAGRARAARGPLRRLLPDPVPPPGARGPPGPPVLAHRAGHPPRAGRVRPPGPQPGDLPGRRRRAARSTSPTWSTSC